MKSRLEKGKYYYYSFGDQEVVIYIRGKDAFSYYVTEIVYIADGKIGETRDVDFIDKSAPYISLCREISESDIIRLLFGDY